MQLSDARVGRTQWHQPFDRHLRLYPHYNQLTDRAIHWLILLIKWQDTFKLWQPRLLV
jgi:hypothetical protein